MNAEKLFIAKDKADIVEMVANKLNTVQIGHEIANDDLSNWCSETHRELLNAAVIIRDAINEVLDND